MTTPVDPLVPPGSADVVLPEPLSETVEPERPDPPGDDPAPAFDENDPV